MEKKKVPTIEELYPNFTPEQQEDAAKNLRAYMELGLRMYTRIIDDPKEHARFKEMITAQQLTENRKEEELVADDKKFDSSWGSAQGRQNTLF